MADIQLDVASANRFISSLSKSLQALCHGCMDFDAGIEIVGYINVNIDSGSKVDYVLNEKVLKSTTNSMTFVSNSFLAKKDQPKICKDGSCSPIPELNQPQQRTQGNYTYPATQLYRSSGIYSPHSQVVRGSQKRQWAGGDWRMSPRKFSRGAKSQHGSYQQQQQQSSPSQNQNESYSQYPNQQIPNTSSTSMSSQQSLPTSQQEYDNSGGDQSDVNIKKEVEDSTGESAAGGEFTDQNNPAGAEDVNIKADPDAVANQDASENLPPKSETNISDSFLQQPNKTDEASEDPNNTDANPDNNESNYEDPSYSESYGEEANVGEGGDNSNSGADAHKQSGADANYDESGEMYSESYSGEGTSGGGGGQFEVIEIDDDDEDVAAMFDDTRPEFDNIGISRAVHSSKLPGSAHSSVGQAREVSETVRGLDYFQCEPCHMCFYSLKSHQRHMNDHHRDEMKLPFICALCNMGFYSKMGLKDHEVKHQGLTYSCQVCPSTYTVRKSLLRHLAQRHRLRQCYQCQDVYPINSRVDHVCSILSG